MSLRVNVEMYRTRLKSLESPGHAARLNAMIEHEVECLANIQARLDRLIHERDNLPDVIATTRANLKDALKRERLGEHAKAVDKMLELQAKIQEMEDAARNEDD